MKKNVWKLLLISILLLALTLFCVACVGEQGAPGNDAHQHTWGTWQITTQPTCDVLGIETRECACGSVETKLIPAKGHTYGAFTVTAEATCISVGEQHHTCSTCQYKEFKTIPAGDGEHTFTAKLQTTTYQKTAPTCQSAGEYYYKCADCDAKGVETYTGDALGEHSFTSKTQTLPYLKSAANCESPALYYYKCQWCTAKGEKTYTVGSEQHDFTAQVQTEDYLKSAESCQSAAIYYFKCTLCDDHGTSTYKVGTKTKHTLDANHICSMCSNAYIYFGEYPQTIKADDVTITETTDSRGYYLGSDNAYYAKVTADPKDSDYTFSNGSTVINGTVYYFKVEPILWRIIAQSDEAAMILCDSIIANKAYDSSSNNYAESDIRAWLNDQFYNTAFTALEQELILTTTVDNSAASTGDGSNPDACENTNDKVFLLSYAEVTNSAYGFSTSTSRQMQTSDYSRATGAYTNIGTDTEYGNGGWWLRSPYYYYSPCARCVYSDGYIYRNYSYVSYTYCGVVPALQIRLQ